MILTKLTSYFQEPRCAIRVIAIAVITLGAFLGSQGCNGAGKETTDAPKAGKGRGGRRGDAGGPVPVLVTTVTQKNVPINIDVIGNVEAYSTISVKAQIGGQLTYVGFQEGDFVKKNDHLFTIDPRPYDAALNQAKANLARDTAALSQAEANLAKDMANEKYARAEAGRYAQLMGQGIVSKEQADQVGSNADALSQAVIADKAAIESAKAQIIASRAAVENAQVQLSYTTIESPIDGRTGNLAVKQGNIVTPNTMEMMTITQLQPIYVTFAVPEAQLPNVKKYMGEAKLPVFASPQDDISQQQMGVLTFIDNTVDPTTGTIKLKGTFPNTENKLWPGEFVRVTLRLTMRANAVVVPNQAVQTGQDGQFVYVVKQDRTVEMRPVVTGTRVDQELVVDRGLQPGEMIVTEGQLRLTPGSRVQVPEGRAGSGRGRGGRVPGDSVPSDSVPGGRAPGGHGHAPGGRAPGGAPGKDT
jgi:multidrug efflux system membrane fusion protein